jgi:hypothetical protein
MNSYINTKTPEGMVYNFPLKKEEKNTRAYEKNEKKTNKKKTNIDMFLLFVIFSFFFSVKFLFGGVGYSKCNHLDKIFSFVKLYCILYKIA